jgi:hypothetical protein
MVSSKLGLRALAVKLTTFRTPCCRIRRKLALNLLFRTAAKGLAFCGRITLLSSDWYSAMEIELFGR